MSSTPSSGRVSSRSRSSGMLSSTPSKRGVRSAPKVEYPAQLPPLDVEEKEQVVMPEPSAEAVETVVEEPTPRAQKTTYNRYGKLMTISVNRIQDTKAPASVRASQSPVKVVEGPSMTQSFLRLPDDSITIATEPSVVISTRRLSDSSSFFLPLETAVSMPALPSATSLEEEVAVAVEETPQITYTSCHLPQQNSGLPVRCAWQVASWLTIPPSLVWMEVGTELHAMDSKLREDETEALLAVLTEGVSASSDKHARALLQAGWTHTQAQLREKLTLNSINAAPQMAARKVGRAQFYRAFSEPQRAKKLEERPEDLLERALADSLDRTRDKTLDLSTLGFFRPEPSAGSFGRLARFQGSRHCDDCACTATACVCAVTTPWERLLLRPDASWTGWLFSQAVSKLRNPEVRVMLKPPVPDARLSSPLHVKLFVWSSLPCADTPSLSSSQPSLLPICAVLSLLHSVLTMKAPVPFFSQINRAQYTWATDVACLPLVTTARVILSEQLQSEKVYIDKDRRELHLTANSLLEVFQKYPSTCLSASSIFHIPEPITAGSAVQSILCSQLTPPLDREFGREYAVAAAESTIRDSPASKTVEIALGLTSWMEPPVHPEPTATEQLASDGAKYIGYADLHSVLSSGDQQRVHNWAAYTLPPAACLPASPPPPVPAMHMSLAPPHGIININGTSVNLYTVYGVHPFSGYWAWRETVLQSEAGLPFLAKFDSLQHAPNTNTEEGVLLALAQHNTFSSRQAHLQWTRTPGSPDIPLGSFYAATGRSAVTLSAFENHSCGTTQCPCQTVKLSSPEQQVYALCGAMLPHPFMQPSKSGQLSSYSHLVAPLKKMYVSKVTVSVADLYVMMKTQVVMLELSKPLAHMTGVRVSQCSRHLPPHPASMCVCGVRQVNGNAASLLVVTFTQTMQFLMMQFTSTGLPTHQQQCKEQAGMQASLGATRIGLEIYDLISDQKSTHLPSLVITLVHAFFAMQCNVSTEIHARQFMEVGQPAPQIPYNVAFGPRCFDMTMITKFFPSGTIFTDPNKTPFSAVPSTIFEVHSDGSLTFDRNMANSFMIALQQQSIPDVVSMDPIFQTNKTILELQYPCTSSFKPLGCGKVVVGKAIGMNSPPCETPASHFPFSSELYHSAGVQNAANASLLRVCVDSVQGDIYIGSEHTPLVCVFGVNSLFWTREESIAQGCILRAMFQQKNSSFGEVDENKTVTSGMSVYTAVLGMPIGQYRELHSIYKNTFKEQQLLYTNAMMQLHRQVYQQHTSQTEEALFHHNELRYEGKDSHSTVLETVPWAPRNNTAAARIFFENAKSQLDAQTGEISKDLHCLEENAVLWSRIGQISKPTETTPSRALDTIVDSLAPSNTGLYINTSLSAASSPVNSPSSAGTNSNAAAVLWRRLQKLNTDLPSVFVNPLNGANTIVASLHVNTAKAPCQTLGSATISSITKESGDFALTVTNTIYNNNNNNSANNECNDSDGDTMNIPGIYLHLNTGIYPFSCAPSSRHYVHAASLQKKQTALSIVHSLSLNCSQMLSSDLDFPKHQQSMVFNATFGTEAIGKRAYAYIFDALRGSISSNTRVGSSGNSGSQSKQGTTTTATTTTNSITKKGYNGVLPVGWEHAIPSSTSTWSSYPPQSVQQVKAACVIQQWWRRCQQRDQRNREHRKRTHAATVIQRQYRKHLQKRVDVLQVAAIKIQAVWKGYKTRQYVQTVRQYATKAHIADNAAVKIQRFVRAFQQRKLQRVKNVLVHEQAGYITSLVSFFQQCYRVRMQRKRQNAPHEFPMLPRRRTEIKNVKEASQVQQGGLSRSVVTEYTEPVAITSLTQLSCCLTFLKLLSAVRMRLSLSEVDKTVRNMVEKRRAEAVQRRGRILAVILVQKKWRRLRKRIQQRKQIEALRESLVTVRNAQRRYVLAVRLSRAYGPEKMLVLLRLFDSMNFYPNPN